MTIEGDKNMVRYTRRGKNDKVLQNTVYFFS